MKKFLIFLIFLSLFLTGCWDRRELNELAITLAFGIDKVEDEYQITAQVVVPSEVSMKASTGRSSVTLFKARGKTVYEAIRKITKESPRKVYPGHLRMLVIGEELAKEGIGESLELLARDWELRSDFYVAIAKDATAEELLNVTTTIESIPANKMFNTLRSSENSWAGTNGITLDELIEDLISEGKEAVLTGVMVIGDQELGSSKQNVESITPAARIVYDELAVFKKDKLVGWLTEIESRGYNAITNQLKTTVSSISCPETGKATIEIIDFKSEIKGKVKNGSPEVDIQSHVNANVGAVECPIDLTKLETFDNLEKTFEKEVKVTFEESIETLKEFEVDIFGFGEAIHRSNPKEWEKMKETWGDEFPHVKVNITIDAKLRRSGTIDNSFLEKLKD